MFRMSRVGVLVLWLGSASAIACNAEPSRDDAVAALSLELGSAKLDLAVGDSMQLRAAVATTSGAALYTLRFASSDAKVVTVTDDGLVKAIAGGPATITATASLVGSSETAVATVAVDVRGAANVLTLSSLPPAETTATSASIGYALAPPYANDAVWCRRDQFAPVRCPNPFVLGASTPLSVGAHRVDFYVDHGSGFDVAHPEVSHAWTIVSGAAPTTPTPTGPTSNVAPLPAPIPDATPEVGPRSDGSVRYDHVLDPNGSGRMVNLHRIYASDPLVWGGQRSECFWFGLELTPANDFWIAFAVQRKVGESQVATTQDDEVLVFQTHTPQAGDTQPDIALFASGQSGRMRWRSAYNASGAVNANGWMTYEGNPVLHTEPMPATGVWWRYIVHYRPGYQASHQPRLRVFRAKPGQDYELLFDDPRLNTYNTSITGAGASYPRIGPYKWSTWTTPSLAWYETPLYFGRGADLYEAAKASLAGL